MYLFKSMDLISELFRCISTILNSVPVSLEDNMKHRIRKSMRVSPFHV